MEWVRRREALKGATAKLYLDTIVPFVRAPKPRLLEIGCGSGDSLIEAQSRGFEVEGLEYSEHAATDANARLGCSAVRVGSPDKHACPQTSTTLLAPSMSLNTYGIRGSH